MRGFHWEHFHWEDFDTDFFEEGPGAGFEPVEERTTPTVVHKLFQRRFEGNVRKDLKEKIRFLSPILKDVNYNILFNPSILKDITKEISMPFIINQNLEAMIEFKGEIIPLPKEFNIYDVFEAYKVLKSKKYYYDDVA